jgi:transposase
MHDQPTRPEESTRDQGVLYLAFEMGRKEWKLGFTTQAGQKARLRTIRSGDLKALEQEIALASQRFGLKHPLVVSCYEAGRDGFWLHRWLKARGIDNVVVDPASLEVNRRSRRAKTDRLDAQMLLTRLIRFHSGEKKVWSVVRVPTPEQEDDRHLSRELDTLKQEQTRHLNRLQSLLVSQGVFLAIKRDFLTALDRVRLWDGTPLGPELKERLRREYERLQRVQEQIRALQDSRKQRLATGAEPAASRVQQLMLLKGIGETSSWLFVLEFFAWRQFRNRREVASLAGLVPTPYQSGDGHREQGISKAGNPRLRRMIVEIAWSWLRWQPESRLSLWFKQRFGGGNRRLRRVGIVALARRLLVELWRYLQTGAVPEGAVLS